MAKKKSKKKKEHSPAWTDTITLSLICALFVVNLGAFQYDPFGTIGRLLAYYIVIVGIVHLVRYNKK